MKIFFSKNINKSLLDIWRQKVKYNYLLITILVFLLALFIFSIINLVMVFKLRAEWRNVQVDYKVASTTPVMKYYDDEINRITIPEALSVQINQQINRLALDETNRDFNVNDDEGSDSSDANNQAASKNIPNAKPELGPDSKNTSPQNIVKTGPLVIISNQLTDDFIASQNTVLPGPAILVAGELGSEKINQQIIVTENMPESPIKSVNRTNWKYNVFGDGFSNSYYVNMGKTNFYYDEISTAFSFTPLYDKRDNGSCTQKYCDFSEQAQLGLSGTPNNQKHCLAKNNNLCLSFDGKNLLYNDNKVKEFSELFLENIPTKTTIHPLANYWLIGAVWSENGQEIGRAWRFDGRKITALDPERRFPFITRQGYGGSGIYFGGDEENYLVIYAGYDLAGYQVVKDTLWNISDFFNIRLAGGGFIPQIIKQPQGEETVWYICSLTSSKPRLIKMWQNGSEVIRGLVSLGESFYSNADEAAICRPGTDGYLEIATVQNIKKDAKYNKWSLIDKGFDQAPKYKIISANLSTNQGRLKMANFSGLSICGVNNCGSSALGDDLKFTISNDAANWQKIIIGQEYLFDSSGANLLWKLEALTSANKNYYSPWFGAINSVYYSWLESSGS